MDLRPKDRLFLVGGASSGLGKAIAELLLREGARVLAIARSKEKLIDLTAAHQGKIETLTGDLTHENTIESILDTIGDRPLSGVVINAGGPPPMPAMETSLEDWDEAYRTVVRWKIALTKALLPSMITAGYGRLLYVESVSVKQPIENLALSNSMRLAVVGYVKTLSQEIAASGVTLTILGPGMHATPRMQQLIERNSEQKGIPLEKVREHYKDRSPMKEIGDPEDFASLALWLLSPLSRYVTGQTITVDGGIVKGTFG